ncbi:MAG: hypothetical protein AAB846_00520, partial [Patescibacteria group bacterium]
PEGLAVTYFTEDSITAHHEYRLKGREIIFRKHFEDFEKHPKILAAHAFTIGNTKALRGDFQNANKYLKLAARARPLRLKYFIAYLASFLGSKKIYRFLGGYAKHIV